MQNSFELFGTSHLAALALIVIAAAILPRFIKTHSSEIFERNFRYSMAALIWIQEIILNIYRVVTDTWIIQTSLALHLCGLAILVLPIMLIRRSYFLYELTYFWGLAGATQALLTPNIDVAFPHFRYWQFFISHGLIIFAVIYATVIFSWRPTANSAVKAFFVTLGLLLPIGAFNWLTGSNYFFIAHKPPTASVLDYMGPWPLYILGMIAMGILMFSLVYLPVKFLKKDPPAPPHPQN